MISHTCRELLFSQYILQNKGTNMKIAYKITDSEMRTYNGFQWKLGKWYETTGKGDLCSPGWFHFYSDPLVGMFMNPVHAGIENPRLFRVEVEGKVLDDYGLKCGYSRARFIEEIPVPQISPVQRVRFAILCAKEVYKGRKWNKWADNWLSGKDRTEESAASVESAIIVIESAAESAASATESAFYATRLALSTEEIAFYATKSAVSAAKSAFYAVKSAAESATKSKKIDLIRIARKAMKK